MRELVSRRDDPVAEPAPRAQEPGAEPLAAPAPLGRRQRLTPGTILSLQRTAGNAAVVRRLEREGRITTGQLAANLQQERARRPGNLESGGPVRFRLNTAVDIKAMLASGKIPEDKLKDAMALVLTRMAKESKLATADTVPDIIKKIFPAAGTFDEAEFEKVVDVKDRDLIYQTVVDAETKVNSADKAKLIAVMGDAAKLIEQAMADADGLKEVFGKKAGMAKLVYKNAKDAMDKTKANLDKAVDTDYNRDDEQTGLGGWANFSSQHIHLERKVAQVADADDAKVTLIHECCHLANAAVDDRGYYGSDAFEGMNEDEKVGNAAHYEELPRRILGTSSYDGVTFTPGQTKSGGKATFEDKVRRDASEYLRKAWDKAVDVHGFLRGIRKDVEGGKPKSFDKHKMRILELSKLEHLTIHQQTPSPTTINPIDIVLSEGVAHATTLIQEEAPKQAVPAAPAAGKSKKDYVAEVVSGSIKSYGALTGNDADDKTLMDWLVKEYRKDL